MRSFAVSLSTGTADGLVHTMTTLFEHLPGSVDRLPLRSLPIYPADEVASILTGPVFGERVELQSLHVEYEPSIDFAVAVPVRDEQAFLPKMLSALYRSFEHTGRRGMPIFIVNDTTDQSNALIVDWLMRNGQPGLVADVQFAPSIRYAPFARRLAFDIAARIVPDGVLFTTDADSEVGPHWVREGLNQIAAGYDLVCEDVRLDDAGLSALPDQVRFVGEAERSYYAACDTLWRRWSGTDDAFAHRASGASLALHSDTYRALGGLPLPMQGEDAALCEMVLARGGRVITIADGGTRTSARLDGRAAGGCGEALSKRARHKDPECDVALVPIEELRRLATFRRTFGVREEAAPGRAPLRYSELLRELGQAQALLAEGPSA